LETVPLDNATKLIELYCRHLRLTSFNKRSTTN
jgi:hypothetical protein